MHYFQFEIKEWVSNTAHLSLEEEAIYLRLVNFYYDSEKPIPSDIEMISRKLRIANIQMTYAILHEFFTECESGFIHERCDLEIAKYHAKSEQASKAGKASAERRFNTRSTPVQPIINQESLIINHKPIKNIAPPKGVDVSLWNDYLKVRKAAKKPLTDTALKGLIREAEKAKITLSDALQTCCERSWVGFKAEWVKEEVTRHKQLPLVTNEQIEEAYKIECGKDPKLARFGSYYEMKDYVIKQRELRSRA